MTLCRHSDGSAGASTVKHQAEGRRADISGRRHGSRAVAVVLVTAALVWTVAACGSGAVEGPEDEASTNGGGGGNNGGGNNGGGNNGGGNNGGGNGGNNGGNNGGGDNGGGGNEFSWSLPGGDFDPDQIGEAFNKLQKGDCAGTEEWLDLQAAEDDPQRRWPWMSPGQEELYEAAIAACKGDLAEARAHLEAASVGPHPGDCRLNEAIRSVLEQRPQADCPGSQSGAGTSSNESTATTTTESDDSTTESATTSTSSPASTDAGDGGSTSTVGGGTDTAS
jgi:hypothetical protein